MFKRINNLIGIFLNHLTWGKFIAGIPQGIVTYLTFMKVYEIDIPIWLFTIAALFITWLLGFLSCWLGWKDASVRHQSSTIIDEIKENKK